MLPALLGGQILLTHFSEIDPLLGHHGRSGDDKHLDS